MSWSPPATSACGLGHPLYLRVHIVPDRRNYREHVGSEIAALIIHFPASSHWQQHVQDQVVR